MKRAKKNLSKKLSLVRKILLAILIAMKKDYYNILGVAK
jgi:hypothetical protein